MTATDLIYERETAGMTPLAVYDATQRSFRRELEFRISMSLAGWSAEDMLEGRKMPWTRDGQAFCTCWFHGLPVILGGAR